MKTLKANTPFPRYRIAGLKGAIESFEMFDSVGNCAAAALFDMGHDNKGKRIFELSLWHFNNAVSINYRGPLGLMKNRMERFFNAKEAQGFFCPQEVPATKNIS